MLSSRAGLLDCSPRPRLHRRPGMCLPLLAAGCCSLGLGSRCAAACQQRRKAGRQHTGARHPGAAPPTARRPATGPCALRPTAVRPADSGAAAHRGWGCRSGMAIRGGAWCSCRRTGPGDGRSGARRSAERIRTGWRPASRRPARASLSPRLAAARVRSVR